MPAFNWDPQVYCGDAPPTQCDPIPEVSTVTAPHGTNPNGGCPADLISPDHPALLVSLSDVQTELRSGAGTRPIPIDKVQETGSQTVPTLMFRNAIGQMSVWNPDANCSQKKVIVDNGDFKLIDDTVSNVFDGACIGSFADIEYGVGATSFIDCNGQQKVKLIFFPIAEWPYMS
jgi:hypothetical protein